MKNYYEILEISNNASQETIERVYKLLAKKYHPDLNPENPEAAAEKFKEISEAYEILSDSEKREKYNRELEEERKQIEYQNQVELQRKIQKEMQSNVNNYDVNFKNNIKRKEVHYEPQSDYTVNELLQDKQVHLNKEQEEYYRNLQEYQMKKAYNDAYIEALKSMGVEIVYKKTFKEYLRIFATIIILIIILFVLWQIPAIRENIIDVYEQSGLLKSIIDVIINLITTIFNNIKNLVISK